jgi:hypothetical protein
MNALDEVLMSYRDMFGAKTERANGVHRAARAEVAEMRALLRECLSAVRFSLDADKEGGFTHTVMAWERVITRIDAVLEGAK